jgi:hypothetical protein
MEASLCEEVGIGEALFIRPTGRGFYRPVLNPDFLMTANFLVGFEGIWHENHHFIVGLRKRGWILTDLLRQPGRLMPFVWLTVRQCAPRLIAMARPCRRSEGQ